MVRILKVQKVLDGRGPRAPSPLGQSGAMGNVEEAVHRYRQQIRQLEEEKRRLEAVANDLRQENGRLQSKGRAWEQQIQTLEVGLKDAQERLDQVNEERVGLREENGHLVRSLEGIRRERDLLAKRLRAFEDFQEGGIL